MNTGAAELADGEELADVSMEVEGPKSLMEIFTPREWPGKIGLWRVALQIPEAPEFSGGGIAIPEEYRKDHQFAMYIGNVRAMGPLCFKAVTQGGIELADDGAFEVGDWVMVDKHAGKKFRMTDDTLWIVISDTQYISVIDHPEQFDCMAL